MSDNILVSIYCITYNHKDYIKKCLDGLVNQKTNFKFEIVIYDDCSTDGTREIVLEYIKKYPDLFIPILSDENRVQKEGFYNINMEMYAKCRGKYLAICEGDDYWTDENKLQIQFNYMEKHSECSGCFHKSVRQTPDGEIIGYKPTFDQIKNKTQLTLKDNVKDYLMETVSVFYRWDIYKTELIELFPKGIISADSFLIYFYSIKGKIGYIDKLMSVKIVGKQGIYNSTLINKDERNVKFGKETINFAISSEKLFKKYNIDLLKFYSEITMKNIIISAIKIKDYNFISNLIQEFPEIFTNIMYSLQEKEELDFLKKKIKKLRKREKIYIYIIFVLSIIFILFVIWRILL